MNTQRLQEKGMLLAAVCLVSVIIGGVVGLLFLDVGGVFRVVLGEATGWWTRVLLIGVLAWALSEFLKMATRKLRR